MNHHLLHERVLEIVARYFKAEAELVEVLQEIDREKAFRALGHTSLFDYAVRALGLSESTAYNFISVARKASEVPALKQEIKAGSLSVAKAKKIVSVITQENQTHWIVLAKTLSKQQLEREVARVNPRERAPDRASFLSENTVALSGSVTEKTYLKYRRIQDLISQSKQKPANLDDVLDAVFEEYLNRRDPVKRAERVVSKKQLVPGPVLAKSLSGKMSRPDPKQSPTRGPTLGKRAALSAAVLHELRLRDQDQCTQHTNGARCPERRWLHFHHLIPKHQGGPDTLKNLTTLCAAHHQMTHTRHLVR